MTHPLTINPELTALSLAHRNQSYIADLVLPKVKVRTESFKYREYDDAQFFTVPETFIGRKGEANEVELKSQLKDASVEAHGLEDFVPQVDIEAAISAGDVNPMDKSTVFTTDLLMLSREKRAAAVMQNADNYINKITLSGSDKLSAAGSSAIDVMQTGIDSSPIAPNYMVTNRIVASYLKRHPDFVKAFHGNSGDKGLVPLKFIADLFGLKEIYVGEALANTAKKGQAQNLSGVWGNHISLYYSNPLAEVDFGLTFAITAEYEQRTVFTYPSSKGVKGGQVIKVVEQLKDIPMCKGCGYLIQNAV